MTEKENGKQALTLANGQAVEQVARDAMKWLGRAEAFNSLRMVSSVGQGVALRNLKETEGALKAAGFKSFTDLCDHLGFKLSVANELIQNLEAFGESFMTAADDLQLTRRHLRAGRALPDGRKPEVRGKLLMLNGVAFDLEKPRDREKVRDEFEALAHAREREAKKAARELEETQAHGEKQIAALKRKLEKREEELRDLGLDVGGKAHPAVELIKMARSHVVQAVQQLRAAVEDTKEAKPEFRVQILSEVNGAAEAAEKLVTALIQDVATALEEG